MLPDEIAIVLIHVFYAYRIPPRRQLSALLYLSGWTYEEIGRALGIQPKTAKMHWSNLMEDLRFPTYREDGLGGFDNRVCVLRFLLGLPTVSHPPASHRHDLRGKRGHSGLYPSAEVHVDWVRPGAISTDSPPPPPSRPRTAYTDELVSEVVRQHQAGNSHRDITRNLNLKRGVTAYILHIWRAAYERGTMDVGVQG